MDTKRKSILKVIFSFSFRYIDDALSSINKHSSEFLHLIYLINMKTGVVSFLFDSNTDGGLQTRLYDKSHD